MKTPRQRAVAVFIIGLVLFSVFLLLVGRHTARELETQRFRESLDRIDGYIGTRDRLRAADALRAAADIADSEFEFTRLMRRAYEYRELWDAPDLLYDITRTAVQASSPGAQRFWAFAVDAAIAAERPAQARSWALEYLQHSSFQDLVLEAVLRGGGVTESDGSEFGDLLHLLSRLLQEPHPHDFLAAAELTGDYRYAGNAALMFLQQPDYPAAYTVYTDYPELQKRDSGAAAQVLAARGYHSRALDILESYPPVPEVYLQQDMGRLYAELLLRTGDYARAVELWNERIQIDDDAQAEPSDIMNLLYAQANAAHPFAAQADTALYLADQYPDRPETLLTLLRWYRSPEYPFSPFEPELREYHRRVGVEIAYLRGLHAEDPLIRIFDTINGKLDYSAERYRAELWLDIERREYANTTAELLLFHSIATRNYADAQAIARHRPEMSDRIDFYLQLVLQEFAHIDTQSLAEVVDPRIQFNLGLLQLARANPQAANEYFRSAIATAGVLSVPGERSRVVSYARAGMAAAAYLQENYQQAAGYARESRTLYRDNPLARQIELALDQRDTQ